MKIKKPKAERKRDREIVDYYHKFVTEKELESLYEQFKQWNAGELDYNDLTELIHQFHKKNQEIWKTFNYDNDEHLVFKAKQALDMFNEKDMENELYQRLWDLYED